MAEQDYANYLNQHPEALMVGGSNGSSAGVQAQQVQAPATQQLEQQPVVPPQNQTLNNTLGHIPMNQSEATSVAPNQRRASALLRSILKHPPVYLHDSF
jgi:hypothetical protein